MLRGMDEEGGGPISVTSSQAFGGYGLPDTHSCLSLRPCRRKLGAGAPPHRQCRSPQAGGGGVPRWSLPPLRGL